MAATASCRIMRASIAVRHTAEQRVVQNRTLFGGRIGIVSIVRAGGGDAGKRQQSERGESNTHDGTGVEQLLEP
jgi:hypothetical protein